MNAPDRFGVIRQALRLSPNRTTAIIMVRYVNALFVEPKPATVSANVREEKVRIQTLNACHHAHVSKKLTLFTAAREYA